MKFRRISNFTICLFLSLTLCSCLPMEVTTELSSASNPSTAVTSLENTSAETSETTETSVSTQATKMAQTTETIQTTEASETTVEPIEVTRPTANSDGIIYQPLPANVLMLIDLNNDGQKESVYYATTGRDASSLTVNQDKFISSGLYGFSSQWIFLTDLDIDDNYLDLVLQEEADMLRYDVRMLYFDGKNLIYRGRLGGVFYLLGSENIGAETYKTNEEPDMIRIDGHGNLIARPRATVLHVWCLDQPYMINKSGRLQEIPQEYYYMRDIYSFDFSSKTGTSVTIKMDLPLYASLDATYTTFTAKAGESASLIKTDNKEWIQIKTQVGKICWFRVDGFFVLIGIKSVFSGDVFDGLNLGG